MIPADSETAEKILNHRALKDTGLTAKRPKSSNPKIMIDDVPTEMLEPEIVE